MPLTETHPRIHYELHGETGPEVIMIMGFGMRGLIWKPQLDELARDHRLCILDNRGIGSSPDLPTGPLRMRDMANDVLRVIDAAGLSRPHLVGVSMGGMIAQELAVTHPDRFATLTLIATHPGRSPTAFPGPRALRHFANALTGTPAQRHAAMFGLLYTPEFVAKAKPEVIAARMREQFGAPAKMRVLGAQLSAVVRHDVTSRLSRLKMPVLLVRPGRDVLVPPAGLDRIKKHVPHAQMLRFEDAAHGVTFQKSSELNAALRAFFRTEAM
jgi:3-oxoadipate enol-lactonase